MSKQALTDEIKARRGAGRKISVDLRSDEDTLRAALDNDDTENGEFNPSADERAKDVANDDTPPAGPAPQVSQTAPVKAPPKLMSQLSAAPEVPTVSTQPKEEEWKESDVYRHKKDGFLYQVVKRASDPYDKPVKARVPAQNGHPGLFWEGTNDEFTEHFEKP